MSRKNKGITLLSLGHPYYIRMAFQLAYSIKCNEDIPICLIQNNIQFLTEEQRSYFDFIVDCPKEIYEDKKFLRGKVYLYDLSPFEETIYLDVDMIALNEKKLSQLFEELKDVDFTIANRGCSPVSEATEKTSLWGDVRELSKTIDIINGQWYQLSSEFIYFKKTQNVKRFFERAKQIYDSDINYNKFAHGMADEYAFSISCILNNLYPHKTKYTPIFWAQAEKRHSKIIDPFINENYYGFSMGGARATDGQKGFYNNMLSWYQMKSGKKIEVFPGQSKALYLEERKSI